MLWHMILRCNNTFTLKGLFQNQICQIFSNSRICEKYCISGIILSNLLPWQSILVLNKLFCMTSLRLWQSVINLVVQKNVLLFSPPSMTLYFLKYRPFWKRQKLGHFRKIVLGSSCYWTILINICLCAKYLNRHKIHTSMHFRSKNMSNSKNIWKILYFGMISSNLLP